MFDELHEVWNRPRLHKRIDSDQAIQLEKQLKLRAIWIEVSTIPPNCRDPKDLPVLAAAIDGKAAAIVSGDDDLRADDALRIAMAKHNIQMLGVNSFMTYLSAHK